MALVIMPAVGLDGRPAISRPPGDSLPAFIGHFHLGLAAHHALRETPVQLLGADFITSS